MVYCGKPSKGCSECRKRKTRCDAKPEGCSQCAKARRVCPGYRSQIDIIFRDQSAGVIQKAKASERKKALAAAATPVPAPRDDSQRTPELEDEVVDVTELPVSSFAVDGGWTILPTLDELATGHFISQYIVGIQAPSRGVMDNLAYMHRTSVFDETLNTAVKAISYASYAHHNRNNILEDASRYQYTKAISLTNKALQSPEDCVKDTTLLSIMLLGMYEVVTGANQKSIEAWMEHVRGSAALLQLRGRQQLESPIGRRLFVQANTGILVTSIQLTMPIPKTIMEMTRLLPELIPDKDDFARRAYQIHQAMLDLNQHRAAVGNGRLDNPHIILARFLDLDKRLSEIYDFPTPEWQYQIITTDDPNNHHVVYNGVYHTYPDLLTANLWNAVRVMRGILHEDLRKLLLKGFSARPPTFTLPEHTAQFQQSTDVCYEVQADILASVPQHLGLVAQTASTPSSSGPISQFYRNPLSEDVRRMSEARASGGLNLMWPLFFAGTMDCSVQEVRTYATENLRRIGEDLGIRQALVLARVCESKTDLEAWESKPRVVEDEDD